MIKNLTRHGNSAAPVIERPILELLGTSINTPFEVVTGGQPLVLTPLEESARTAKFHDAMEKIGKHYAKSFENWQNE